jgi:hypothetical protein
MRSSRKIEYCVTLARNSDGRAAELAHREFRSPEVSRDALDRADMKNVSRQDDRFLLLWRLVISIQQRRPRGSYGVLQTQQALQLRACGSTWRLKVHRIDALALAVHYGDRRGVIHCVPAILEWDFLGINVIGLLGG